MQCGTSILPKIHLFLWLVAHNKILTRDNLAKRQSVDDLTYVFCSEHETCAHLLFEYFVAHAIWGELKTLLGRNNIEISFSSIASMWLCEKK